MTCSLGKINKDDSGEVYVFVTENIINLHIIYIEHWNRITEDVARNHLEFRTASKKTYLLNSKEPALVKAQYNVLNS
jgi:hypothetical protein